MLVTESDKFIYKVKGLSHNGPTLCFSYFENLLFKDSNLEINQDKWFKSLDQNVITIKEQLWRHLAPR